MRGTFRWKWASGEEGNHPSDFVSAPAAYQAAVLRRFPRTEWEAKVDRGVVRTRYWAWALVRALESLGEQVPASGSL